MASQSGVLYVGMANHLFRRVLEHRSGKIKGFTQKYHVNQLVYYEEYDEVAEAIAREKQIKRWRREKKTWLIESENPHWKDLSTDWQPDMFW